MKIQLSPQSSQRSESTLPVAPLLVTIRKRMVVQAGHVFKSNVTAFSGCAKVYSRLSVTPDAHSRPATLKWSLNGGALNRALERQ